MDKEDEIMKVLITSDFYSDFELYETEHLNGLKNWIALSIVSDKPIDLDPKQYKLIGNQDTMDTQDAIDQADETLFTSDFMED